MKSASKQAIIVFLRVPEAGKVKTRLARDVGDVKALEIYNQLVQHTVAETLKVTEAVKLLFYFPHIDDQDLFLDPSIRKFQQINGDLGDKMSDAFSKALSEYDQAIIIGTDCPYIDSDLLTNALMSLHSHDIVIGPAEDGGYYLLGMNKLHARLFDQMEWSTDTVFSETLQRAENLELTVQELITLSDIDYASDWKKYQQLIQSQQ